MVRNSNVMNDCVGNAFHIVLEQAKIGGARLKSVARNLWEIELGEEAEHADVAAQIDDQIGFNGELFEGIDPVNEDLTRGEIVAAVPRAGSDLDGRDNGLKGEEIAVGELEQNSIEQRSPPAP